jgi:carbon-monoxide dehydrogenase iron sulfur subunit
MAITVKTKCCTGCRACELACSFYHLKLFSRKISSILVKRNEKEGMFTILIYHKPEDSHLACDCGDDEEFCVSYCPIVARDELKAILHEKED